MTEKIFTTTTHTESIQKRFLETISLCPILMPISLIYLAVMCFGRKEEQREGRVYLLLLMEGALLQNMVYIYLLN
jgi:hypothetical protein